MRTTVVGVFDSRADAEAAIDVLEDAGFERRQIDLRSTSETSGAAAGEGGSWWDWLFGESDDRSVYSDSMRRGNALVAVTTDEAGADRARRLMEAGGGDVERGGAEPRSTTDRPQTATSERATSARGWAPNEEQVVPVVEERLRLGKRPVARGGVRVYSRVSERPVEEQVSLTEEQVRVQRRPVDRPITDAPDAFREDVVEVTETAEEPVVAKEARVVEEVVIGKEADTRVEEVSDRVRRTEVEVERLGASDSDPTFRFGNELADDPRWAGQEWSAIEPDARRRWDEHSPGTWERAKDSIRQAWEGARGRRRAA
jgi:uncharacterized protein (TIGR02271 family)